MTKRKTKKENLSLKASSPVLKNKFSSRQLCTPYLYLQVLWGLSQNIFQKKIWIYFVDVDNRRYFGSKLGFWHPFQLKTSPGNSLRNQVLSSSNVTDDCLDLVIMVTTLFHTN